MTNIEKLRRENMQLQVTIELNNVNQKEIK